MDYFTNIFVGNALTDEMRNFLDEYIDAVSECAVKFSKKDVDKNDIKEQFTKYLLDKYDFDKTLKKHFKSNNTLLWTQMLEYADEFLKSKGFMSRDYDFIILDANFFLRPDDDIIENNENWREEYIIKRASPQFLEIINNRKGGKKSKRKRTKKRKTKTNKKRRRAVKSTLRK